MSDEINWSERTPHVRHRRCPGCGEELSRFYLSAMQMPIEQFTIPHLKAVNEALDFSVRPFGFQNFHELQFLSFTSNCSNCTLISNWDFGTEELDEIFASDPHPPFAQIGWNYNPTGIELLLQRAPQSMKHNLQLLLDAIRPRTDEQKK